MRTTTRLAHRFAAVSASVLLVAACGGSDGDDSDDGGADAAVADGAGGVDEDGDETSVVYERVVDLGTEPFIVDLTGIEEPLMENFADLEVDPTEPSVRGVRAYFDLGYPEADWRLAMAESGSTSFGKLGSEWSIAAADLGDDPLVVCEAALGYFRSYDSDARVVVAIIDRDSFDETPVAAAERGEGCALL